MKLTDTDARAPTDQDSSQIRSPIDIAPPDVNSAILAPQNYQNLRLAQNQRAEDFRNIILEALGDPGALHSCEVARSDLKAILKQAETHLHNQQNKRLQDAVDLAYRLEAVRQLESIVAKDTSQFSSQSIRDQRLEIFANDPDLLNRNSDFIDLVLHDAETAKSASTSLTASLSEVNTDGKDKVAETGVFSRGWRWFRGKCKSVISGVKSACCAVKNTVVGTAVEAAELVVNTYRAVGRVCQGIGVICSAAGELTVDAGKAIWNGAKSCGAAVKSCVEFLLDKQTWISLWDKTKSVAGSIKTGAEKIVKFLRDPETWKTLGQKLQTTWEFASSPETWSKAWELTCRAGAAVKDFVSNPERWLKAAEAVRELYRKSLELTVWCIQNPGEALRNCLSASWRGTKAVGSFLKSVSDYTGITDLAVGLYHTAMIPWESIRSLASVASGVAKDFVKLAKGEISADQLKENFKSNLAFNNERMTERVSQALRAFKGAGTLVAELTGIRDTYLAISCAIRGDWKGVAFHATFAALSAGALIATISTAGAAGGSMVAVAAGRQTLKQATKQTLRQGTRIFVRGQGKEIGTRVWNSIAAEHGSKAMHSDMLRLATRSADTAGEMAASFVKRHGSQALTPKTITILNRAAAEQGAEQLLKRWGVTQKIYRETLGVLNSTIKFKRRKLAHQVQAMLPEMTRRESRRIAGNLQKALRNGRGDKELMKLIEKGATESIAGRILKASESTFKQRTRQWFTGQARKAKGEILDSSKVLNRAMREQAKSSGRPVKDVINQSVDAAWKGYRQGVYRATSTAVQAGVKKAFRHFRAMKTASALKRLKHRGQGQQSDVSSHHADGSNTGISSEKDEHLTSKQKLELQDAQDLSGGVKVGVRHRVEQSGRYSYVVTEVLDIRKMQWKEVQRTVTYFNLAEDYTTAKKPDQTTEPAELSLRPEPEIPLTARVKLQRGYLAGKYFRSENES